MRDSRITRRAFVRSASTAVAAGAAIALPASGAHAQEAAAGEMPMRKLGKTDLMVSVASLGSFGLTNPGVLEAALDAGVNLIDTGPGYGEGNAERAVGQAMQKRRDEAVLSTKFAGGADATKEQLLSGLDGSLKRLQTDHVDIVQIGMADPGHFANTAFFEAFREAKAAGKARFMGFSAHGDVPNVVTEGIGHDDVAVAMVKYNVMEQEGLNDVLAKAAERSVGVFVMKAGAGNREAEDRQLVEGVDAEGAKVRWALSNANIASVCCRMLSFEDVDKFVAAVKKPLTEADLDFLERYRQRFATAYCRACGSCSAGCPQQVAVADIMRYHMYFRYYGFEKEAMRLYAQLPEERRAGACAGCTGGCTASCPYGLSTKANMVEADGLLTLA